jgi:carboxyl-terminal processing protease
MSIEKPEIQNSKSIALRPLIFALVLSVGLFSGMNINKEKKDRFSQIFDIINNDYVDSTRIDLLEENAIDYLLSQLDPHSSYIPAQLSEINDRQIRGNYQGLGIEYIQFRYITCNSMSYC